MPCEVVLLSVDFFKMAAVDMETAKMLKLLVRRAKARQSQTAILCYVQISPHSYLTYVQFDAGIMSYFLFHEKFEKTQKGIIVGYSPNRN
jgi:hypothetical protein